MIRPVGYRVLVEPDKIDEKTKGGLFLPPTTQEREQHAAIKGTVIAVGAQAWDDDDEPWVGVGDRIIFAKYGGFEVEDEGKTYRILNDEDVVAIVE
jgi:chaperonin GroES